MQIKRFYKYAFLFCLVFSGLTSLYLGQDANWDLKNYHIYNAWSYLEGRQGLDIAPAGIQSFFSPYLDIPYYFVSMKWLPNYPRLVAFLFGFPYGIVLFCVICIVLKVAAEVGVAGSGRFLLAFLFAIIGASGVSTISQVGTTFNEMYVAAFVLVSILILSNSLVEQGLTSTNRKTVAIVASGILLGIAGGLKLTAVIYTPAVVFALLMMKDENPNKVVRIFWLLLGSALGFLLAYSCWAWNLLQNYDSPFFPMFNSLFGSDWSDSTSYVDRRFLPKNIVQYFFYPFIWANNDNLTVMEPKFIDYRFSLFFLGAVVVVFVSNINKKLLADDESLIGSINQPISFFILNFVSFSYVAWLTLFSILRYAIVIEALGGAIILLALAGLSRLYIKKNKTVFMCLSGMALLVFLGYTSAYPNWGRVKFGQTVFSVIADEVEEGSLVVVLGKPLAFYAPFIALNKSNVSFIGYSDIVQSAENSRLRVAFRDKIINSKGSVYVLVRETDLKGADYLKKFDLNLSSECSRIKSNIDDDVLLCRASKVK